MIGSYHPKSRIARIEPVGKAASMTQNVSGAKETKAKAEGPSAAGESEPGAE